MVQASLPSQYRASVLVIVGLVLIGIAVGVVTAGDSENVDLTQDKLVVESGETVVIEKRNTTTPTDFVVKKGGTLKIRDSRLLMTGVEHHGNLQDISGTISIRNSTIRGEDGIPVELWVQSPNASIRIQRSNLESSGEINKKFPVGVSVWSNGGGNVMVENTTFGGVHMKFRPDGGLANVSVKNSSMQTTTFAFGGYTKPITVDGFDTSMSSMEFSFDGNTIRFSNTELTISPIIGIRGSGTAENLLPFTVKNSTAWLTIWPGSDVDVVNSTAGRFVIKHGMLSEPETFYYSDLPKYGHFQNYEIIDKDYLKIDLENSKIKKPFEPGSWDAGTWLNAPGYGNGNAKSLVVEDSNIHNIYAGKNLTTNNVTIDQLSVYHNTNGVLAFNDTTIDWIDFSTVETNISMKGNVTFTGDHVGTALEPDPLIPPKFHVKRIYPVQIDTQTESEKRPINVFIRSPAGKVIWKNQTSSTKTVVKPVVHFRKSNYNDTFEFALEQGNRSTSRPLTLTTDTPIKIHDGAFSTLNVTGYKAEPKTVTSGENVTITATVENEGNLTDEMTVTFYGNGEAFDNETVKLAGGENTTVSTSTNFAEAGTHTVSVNSLPEVEIQVQIPNTLRVGPDQDYTTIQSAVDAAKPGNTVIVYPGTYTESINIPNSITLRAARNATDTVIVDAGDSGGVITLKADGTRVDGFTLTNPEHAYGGVRVFSDQNVVTNTTFADMGTDIVFSSEAKENRFYLNTFKNGANFFYFGENTTPKKNYWNSSREVTYWYDGNKYTGRMGNYHSEYAGTDSDGDGIGETPYQVAPNNTDYYPLNDVVNGTFTFVAEDDHWWDPYTDNNGVVDDTGINAAVRDYLSEDGGLTPQQLNTLVRSYLSGTPVRELVEE